jgi:hypothetical protein
MPTKGWAHAEVLGDVPAGVTVGLPQLGGGDGITNIALRGLIFALQVDVGAGAQPFNVWA